MAQAFICRLERGADGSWSTWKRLFAALGFDAVLAPLPACEDAEDFLKDAARERRERMEAGRQSRW